ncbi:Ferric reductase domain protein transmembrane component domain [Acidovorax delafieldii 2AN]|uniref:Ferric reductase domain protein transmembrane component domain n=1 Tax=Acidovorax delafieldii 2AN TaxID=573060 RepID=C5T092_ACIDE|nr:ferric reductase-like transmembrane domain-containing protein [Acidovorax delafieldii]EER62045.1 Ferric reductase domain protein transmembrane component domain [Acidovorax delafieldii 2AN]
MKRIKVSLIAILVLLTSLWLAADTLLPEPFNYFSFRSVFIQFSGVLSIGLMSIAMLLALRSKWLDRHLNGLDKMYRLHKWLGICALVAAVLHWWLAKGTKWMVGWGWLERPARKPNAGETLGAIEGWLRGQRGLAESIGEWMFYVAAVLIVLALIRRFPYHLFVKTHKWLAAAYLALAYHSAVLTKFDYWTQPIGWLLAALMLGGSIAAVLALFGQIGAGSKVQGTIESLTEYPALRVLETTVMLNDGWPGHAAGQFAFVTSDKNEGPHPYTIASAWNRSNPRLTFITKALGDHTSHLRERLKIDLPVTVEGPYGCFDFEDTQPHQIWIGAGIGITPFVARLKHRAANPDTRTIDLFHPSADFEQAAIDRLTADAAAAGVRLHLLVDGKDGRLNGERIRTAVPHWRSASVWFCGPAGFGQALRDDFCANGLPDERFHQELFEMR